MRLFDRFTAGYAMTLEGEELLRRVQYIEGETHTDMRRVNRESVFTTFIVGELSKQLNYT